MTKRESPRAAERTVVAVLENLMDGAAIMDAARRLQIRVIVVSFDQALETCERERPVAAVLDLTSSRALTLLAAPALAGIPTVGFYPHVDGALRKRALSAGVGRVLPRSAFFGRLPQTLSALVSKESRLPDPSGGC